MADRRRKISDRMVDAAVDAAFPGLPPDMTLMEAERRMRAGVAAALAVDDDESTDESTMDAARQLPTIEEAISLYREGDRLRREASALLDQGPPEGATMGDLRNLVSTVLLEAGTALMQASTAIAVIGGAYPIRAMVPPPLGLVDAAAGG